MISGWILLLMLFRVTLLNFNSRNLYKKGIKRNINYVIFKIFNINVLKWNGEFINNYFRISNVIIIIIKGVSLKFLLFFRLPGKSKRVPWVFDSNHPDGSNFFLFFLSHFFLNSIIIVYILLIKHDLVWVCWSCKN